jgi:hypothetical protein
MLKAQLSIEYMILTGFVLLIVVVPSVIFLSSLANKSVYGTITTQRTNELGNGIVDTAKQIYYLGIYSKKIVTYDVPNNAHKMFIMKMDKTGPAKTYYYFGLVLNDTKEAVKFFFPSEVPLMSDTAGPYAAYVDISDLSSYVSECTPPTTTTCSFYNFKGSVLKPGKKTFKIETKYEGLSTEAKVSIVPLLD